MPANTSEFWKYFKDVLAWPCIHAPGPLQAVTKGAALALDSARDDIVYLRHQFFPSLCEPQLVADHGQSRGITRHAKESPEQFRQRVVRAFPWHMLGGKTEGLPEILRFYGYEVGRIENMRDYSPARWAEFQVGFKSPASQEEQQAILDNLPALIWLVNEYKPARSFFFRMYTDVFDKRPIVLSIGPPLGDGWLSFFSGVPVDGVGEQDKDTIVSFGVRYSLQSEAYSKNALCGSFGATTHLGFLAPYLDTFRVGRSRLSDVFPRNNPFIIGSLFSILWADRATTGRRWRGFWDARSWLDYTGFDRKLPPWRMEKRAASRAQLVPSWSEEISNHNSKLGAAFAVSINAPARLGEFRLSAHDQQRQEIRLHEFFITTRGANTPAVNPQPPQACGAACHSLTCPEQSAERSLQVMHSELSLAIEIKVKNAVHSGSTLALPLLSVPVAPASAIPSHVRSFRVPLWEGAWTTAGRTWKTSTEIYQ